MLAAEIAGASAMATVHFFAARLRFLQRLPRSQWLSLAAGVSVGYVFVHLLPELAEKERELAGTWLLRLLARHHLPIYLLSLGGLLVFFGLERLARRPHGGDGDQAKRHVYWLHLGLFCAYNLVFGYVLHGGKVVIDEGYWFYVVAMALHFLVNDYGLRELHQGRYLHHGRWILGAAVFVGLALSYAVNVGEGTTGALVAFLSGGIVLNVLKEELPEEREARFLPLVLGACGYAALLISTRGG